MSAKTHRTLMLQFVIQQVTQSDLKEDFYLYIS